MPPRVVESVADLKKLVGQTVGASDWVEVSQSRIDRFAEATEDRQWIHLDRERAAAESPYETTIAHGFLSLSLLSVLLPQAVKLQFPYKMAINYGLNRVRFPAAVPAGSRIRAHCELEKLEEIEGGVQTIWGIRVEVEGSAKPCLVAEWLTRYYR